MAFVTMRSFSPHPPDRSFPSPSRDDPHHINIPSTSGLHVAVSQARALALSNEYSGENLTPLMTCASLVNRSITTDGQRSAQELPSVRGRLFVGQVNTVVCLALLGLL